MDLPTTERLTLRRLTADDLDLFAALHGDPDVARWVGGVKTREQAREMLATRVLGYYEQHPRLGIFAALDRASGDCVGTAVLNHIQGEPLIQVGYVLFKAYWGRGLATEIARAMLRYGYADLGLPAVCAITNRDNVASQRVLVKAGMEPRGVRAFAHPAYADGNPFTWFESERDAWLAAHAAAAARTPVPTGRDEPAAADRAAAVQTAAGRAGGAADSRGVSPVPRNAS
jgi:RimJ/RimL family protein N-acetyltransferase